MIFKETDLQGVFIIEPKVFLDDRGYFFESFRQNLSSENLNFTPIQDNESYNKFKNTLRGFHLQKNPMAQAKLVRCVSGKILDIALDVRKNSDTFGKYFAIELSSENKKQLFIPKGFAHAYLTLEDNCIVEYKVDNYYSKEHDVSIKWNDKDISFPWDITDPILSDKDKEAISFQEFLSHI
ncbi:MAG: dTDP-4-dehydrorhamnose 3,5-epimerase [Alphaproteobacteria bacterium]|mgnify:CR=1 FL=1|nr:dTDP-4-dehydrorhamnose 3,5-epimerase [Alphaproteobacteria bacterium]OJV15996.1 MAG: dTDP-4-dehydrorhamnose 3,5-epimerase [Alphaproteobacteria bacterium 33-17]